MDWDDTDVDIDHDLTGAELTHLQRLTDADADGDERAVDEVAGQAGGATPDVGALLRAALQTLRKA